MYVLYKSTERYFWRQMYHDSALLFLGSMVTDPVDALCLLEIFLYFTFYYVKTPLDFMVDFLWELIRSFLSAIIAKKTVWDSFC